MSSVFQQLHLPLERRREATLEEYVPGSNGEALGAVRLTARGAGEPFLYVFGAPETGKTHLLQGACLAAVQVGRRAHYIPLGQPGLAPGILENLELLDLVALDDLDRIAGLADWEGAIFDLFNRLRECGRGLIVAAAQPPGDLPIALPDLRSRLLWGPRYRLLGLSEADSEALLNEAARARGIPLDPAVARYILTHAPRGPSALLGLLAGLDSLSLRERRPPSIPLVRRVLLGEAD